MKYIRLEINRKLILIFEIHNSTKNEKIGHSHVLMNVVMTVKSGGSGDDDEEDEAITSSRDREAGVLPPGP